ncbi:prephenate dehydrogenase/arogenate dehydrogenase family protein [Desulfonatronospira sp. MSAO_Bac3]|uniref:prephenate dehydrogenase/arogenate dehydrogenase family protein n=1 Tax=Desulfonatronospira sp. MSAO_Bac3 TaxID=2293857 RepID=UPI000FEF452A|nr:prephenate dehydrogenase/arogenate dehydrogenase family protein [Desulfonatronospira sp. MSAO_Bac3]RQD76863.1 MAG: prephenate dehydrogenase [Desulfonatronospira sp. MSAO_Bac3]
MHMVNELVLVGSKGQMGTLIKNKLSAGGVNVLPLDRPFPEEELPDILGRADMLLLAVPVAGMDEVLELMSPYFSSALIVADISSVKTLPVNKMQHFHQGPVMGTHPLFGPSPSEDDELKVALCPGHNLQDHHVQAVSEVFDRGGMHTFMSSCREHDQAMACIQGLNFVTTISYFASLPQDIDLDTFATPSFRRRATAARKMLNEDAVLFSSLAEDNPYTGQMIRRFKSFLNLSAAGEFELLTDKALWWWRNFSDRQGG